MALRSLDLFLLLFFLYKAIPSQGQTLQQYILRPGFSTLSNTGSSLLPTTGLSTLSNIGISPGLSTIPLGTSLSNKGLSSLSSVLLPQNELSFQTVSPKFITTGVPTSPSLIAQPGLPALTIAPPSSGSCSLNPPSTKEGMDSEVLNNLAIALQLLIISNLLNSPLPDVAPSEANCPFTPVESLPASSLPYSVSYASAALPQPLSPASPSSQSPSYYQLPKLPPGSQPTYYQLPPSNTPPTVIQNPSQYYPSYETSPTAACSPPAVMPNANFVGSASYSDGSNVLTTFSGPYASSAPTKPPRASLALMSPYDAISPSSPYSDPILTSPYGSIMTSTRDFKSPYATFDTSKDFYSTYGSDLY